MNEPIERPAAIISDDEIFIRMSRTERWQHGLLAASFAVLMLTGLPLLAYESGLVRLVAGRGGPPPYFGVLHRAAALGLIAELLWHFLYVAMTERGRRAMRDKAPRVLDIKDALAAIGFRSGLPALLRKRGPFRGFFEKHPRWRPDREPSIGRFGFVEKFEYWSVVWGSAVMIVTGLFLWSPALSLKLLPLWLYQVFAVAHGYEALLALLAVLVWHMYTVHLHPAVFPMSRVWLDGRMTGAELRRFHPLEYGRIIEERERVMLKKSMME
jgi:cytochrome b subunit of formate dehydrogenase